MQNADIHIYIATPCYNCSMTARYATSILKFQGYCIANGIRVSIDFMGNESLIPRGRNILVGRFLKSEATHLVFIDSDIGFDPTTVMRLVKADKAIATACYPKKHIDWSTVKSKLIAEDPEDVRSMGLDYNLNISEDARVECGLIRVLDAATGFMVMRRDAVETLCDHYRDTLTVSNDVRGSCDIVPTYVAIFDCMICPKTQRYLSEDFALCRRAQAIGMEIWADVTHPLSHTGSHHFHGDVSTRFTVALLV